MSRAAATISGKPIGIATAHSSSLVGLEARAIRVEVCSTRGPAFFQMVGLAEAAVREARVRVSSALSTLGVLIDAYALTVNLAPADMRKTGASLDVAIAVAVLGALRHLPAGATEQVLFLGELSLDGSIHPVRGVLPQLEGAVTRNVPRAVVPAGAAREAGLVEGIDVRTVRNLEELVAFLRGQRDLPKVKRTPFSPHVDLRGRDFEEVAGQSTARKALEVAAAGGHNVLMIGPPGAGKTMLARRLPTILPELTFEEAIEATAIHSVAGLVDPDKGVVSSRPFRAPHHSVSEAGLVGGGDIPRPGEISLAHNGVLFLDELAEFRRSTLESLRQPLEDGKVCIARARARAWFPARPVVVGAVNPCPCGYSGHPTRDCRCTRNRVDRYLSKLSGPLVDRLDVHVRLDPVDLAALTTNRRSESSASIRCRVDAARRRQALRRARGEVSARTNSELTPRELGQVASPDRDGSRAVERAVERHGLTARAYAKVLRVARTIADLENEPRVRKPHVEEALQGRLLDGDLGAAA